MPYIKSPLNYIGGKFKLLDQILPRFPQNINTFIDLFTGGANVGINAQAERVILNDNLTYLIDLYETLRNNPITDIEVYIDDRINEFQLSRTNAEGFYNLRNAYNFQRNSLDLLLLIAFGFNHQIRFNNNHEFNNPFGRERSSFNDKMRTNLLEFIEAIKNKEINFSRFNFQNFNILEFEENDFIYCDPPYLITTGTYNDGKRGFDGWTETQEGLLLNFLDQVNNRGIRFALSNVIEHKGASNTMLQDWVNLHEFHIHRINSDYSNSNYQTSNRKLLTIEVLVTNY